MDCKDPWTIIEAVAKLTTLCLHVHAQQYTWLGIYNPLNPWYHVVRFISITFGIFHILGCQNGIGLRLSGTRLASFLIAQPLG